MKFRTYNAATASMAEHMGAIPTIVEAVEIPQAFSTGVVDAMVTSGATGVRTKAWDFATYFYDLNAWMPKNMVFVNERAWLSLSDAERQAVLEAAAAAEARGWSMSKEVSESSSKDLAANGMTVEAGSAELLAGLKEIGSKMVTDWEKSAGADGSALLQAYGN